MGRDRSTSQPQRHARNDPQASPATAAPTLPAPWSRPPAPPDPPPVGGWASSRTVPDLAAALRPSEGAVDGPPRHGILVTPRLPSTAPQPVGPAPPRSHPNLAVAPQPDVHVTIGRLEVRTGAVAPPAAQRRAPARLRSLEEYGAQRGGGHR